MKPVSPAAAYAALIPVLVEAAREAGYALAVHGTLARDCDLVAAPWTDEAWSAERLGRDVRGLRGVGEDQRAATGAHQPSGGPAADRAAARVRPAEGRGRQRVFDRSDKDKALDALCSLLECAGCVVEWPDLEQQLRKLSTRALLNLQYRVERARVIAAEEALADQERQWPTREYVCRRCGGRQGGGRCPWIKGGRRSSKPRIIAVRRRGLKHS